MWGIEKSRKETYRRTGGPTRHRNLNDLVSRKDVHAPSWEEILRGACSTQNLQQHRHTGLVEYGPVDPELQSLEVEDDVEVESYISRSEGRSSWGGSVAEGMQVGFDKGVAVRRLGRSWVGIGGAGVPQDGRVETTGEASSTEVGVSTNPVICDRLVGSQYEGVTLTSENLDAVNGQWLHVYSVNLDYRLNGKVSRCRGGLTGRVPWCDCRWKIHS